MNLRAAASSTWRSRLCLLCARFRSPGHSRHHRARSPASADLSCGRTWRVTCRRCALANSPRLSELVRAGMLYLTAQDAIALALENNIDIEVAATIR